MTTAAEYPPVSPQLDLAEIDRWVLNFWREQGIFKKSLERTATGKPWTVFEGPPTANGKPGTHHIEARVFKDAFPRFRTMQGFRVDRQAGWDCHGLPVELQVEQSLGLNGKADIEAYGIAEFNAKCRESVTEHVAAFVEFTERMGYWVDFDTAYWTMNPSYVESVWWALKQIFNRGLLAEDFRVAPYCPRCGTGLSDHELAQGYKTITDPSVYVRMPLTSGPWASQADLLIWTTTPWTLPANALIAVHPEVTYVVAVHDQQRPVVVAEALIESALGEGWTATTQRFTGAEMVGWNYTRPFDLVPWHGPGHFVVAENYVTVADGTGLVHQATVFGVDDMDSVRRNGVELINPINPQGRFEADLDLVGGVYFREANEALITDLRGRDRLFQFQEYEHSYPHCWRCDSALMYYALPSWYIRTTKIKDALLAQNEGTTWYPETIKWGRYGDWLNNNVDWALSRSRYWGTPLPIWRNDADPTKLICVGSLAELSQLTGKDLSQLDPHRPYVDEVTFQVDGSPGVYRRVPEVIDVWFDSGAMPFAQWGYPHQPGSPEQLQDHYPAEFICEAIDQTRGWFYTLMAIGTLVFEQSSYRNVLCLGLLLAEDGRKMSKSLGNILEPLPLMDKFGADPVRWFMGAVGSPWAARRIGPEVLTEVTRKIFLTYWNTVSFHILYARANNWAPNAQAAESGPQVLDRWLISARNQLILECTQALEDFDLQRYGTAVGTFVDNLSNWYVRRSRRRFWAGEPSALITLHDTLRVLTQLMAPLAPFLTEWVWQQLVITTESDAPSSVHLSSWPVADQTQLDPDLEQAMALTKRLVEIGRAARANGKVKIRQPLQRAMITNAAYQKLSPELRAELATELNVVQVEPLSGDLVEISVKANFRALGKRFGAQTPAVAKLIAAADPSDLASSLADKGEVQIAEHRITADEVLITERPSAGWAVINEHGETIALDLRITPELRAAGLVRDVIRVLQEGRKTADFDVSDRISLHWATPDPDLREVIMANAAEIAAETLATQMAEDTATSSWQTDSDTKLQFLLTRVG